MKVQPLTSISTLTGLRGFAVYIVFISHASNFGYLPAEIGKGFGQFGVMIFFILSSFLITRLYVFNNFTKKNVFIYILSRSSRVLPLYYLIVFLSGFGFAYEYVTDAQDWLLHLSLFRAEGILWAVPIEVQFYLLFIVIWFVAIKRGARGLLLLIVLIFVFAAAFFILERVIAGTSKLLPNYISYFIIGTILGFIHSIGRLNSPISPNSFRAGLTSIVVLVLFFLLAPEIRKSFMFSGPMWLDPINAVLMTVFFILTLWGWGVFRFFAHPVLVFLGNISYGFYLWHALILINSIPVAEKIGPNSTVVLVFAASVIAALLSLKCFEQPIQKYLKNTFSKI